MHLSETNEALSHKIVGGTEHQWTCWNNARFLDYESEYGHASVVFDTDTQTVYSAEISDKENKHKPYRWLNPNYKDEYIAEAKKRDVNPNLAWDDTNWYDLETSADWLKKASAIFNGLPVDTRVEVPLDLDNDTLLQLALEAHKRDITINQMVEQLLREVIERSVNEKQT